MAELLVADGELRESLGQLQLKLSMTLASIAEKQAQLNTTLEEAAAAKRRLLEVVYIADTPVKDHLLAKGKHMDEIASEAADVLGVQKTNLQSVNFSAAVEERLLADLEKKMPECLLLLCQCEHAEKRYADARQKLTENRREKDLFDHILNSCRRLDELEPWFASTGMTLAQAKTTLEKDPDAEGGKLDEFLFLHTLYFQYWDNKTEGHLNHVEELTQQKRDLWAASEIELTSAQSSLQTCKDNLLLNCSWRLPRDRWREEHDEILANYTQKRGNDSLGTCTDGGSDDERSMVGLSAPYELWKKDPELYPDRVDVTFVMHYIDRKDMIEPIVQRLWSCTKGILGKGKLANITSQLVVNVEQAGEMETWMKLWKKTEAGEFLIPIFTHNVGALRGFNSGARVAKGYIVVFLYDDDVPPDDDCKWLENIVRTFESWPKLGLLGLDTGYFSISNPKAQYHELTERSSDNIEHMRMRDPKSKVRMQFSSSVAMFPSAVRRSFFVDMGGFDESALSSVGRSAPVLDRHTSLRMWLAGYKVAQMFVKNKFKKEEGGGKQRQTEAEALGKAERRNVDDYVSLLRGYEEKVSDEVKRMNGFLEVVDPWE